MQPYFTFSDTYFQGLFNRSTFHRYGVIIDMQRLQNLANSLAQVQISAKSDDDVVICSAVRTPITKGKKGGLKNTAPEVMLSVVLREAAARAKLKPQDVEDIAVGNNLQPGAGELTNRMAMFLAGYPDTTTIVAVNRLCSSGLEACAIIAAKIKAGIIDVGVGSGVESMSLYDMNESVKFDALSETVFEHEKARTCLTNMGETSDNVAKKFNVSR